MSPILYPSVKDAIESTKLSMSEGAEVLCEGRDAKDDCGAGVKFRFRVVKKDDNKQDNHGTIRDFVPASTCVLEYVKDNPGAPVSVRLFGAKGDGVTNDTAAFDDAVAAERCIFVPQGTYVLAETTKVDSIRISTDSKNTPRDGRHIFGEILDGDKKSILKLSNNSSSRFCMFIGGEGQYVKDWHFSDFIVDLNGFANHAKVSPEEKEQPHSYAFIYAFCPCYNVLIENIDIKEACCKQIIRLGGDDGVDDSGKWLQTGGDHYRLKNISIKNFGDAVPNYEYGDTSALYLNGSDILIEDCSFVCDEFDFSGVRIIDGKRHGIGHTAIELHPGKNVVVRGCYFEEIKAPVGIYSDFNAVDGVTISDSTVKDCACLARIITCAESHKQIADMRNILIDKIRYTSKKRTTSVIDLGSPIDKIATKEISVRNSLFMMTNRDTGFGDFVYNYSRVLTKLEIERCVFKDIEGPVFYCVQTTRTPRLIFQMRYCILDSCGERRGDAPDNRPIHPAQVYISPDADKENKKTPIDIEITNCIFTNSSDFDYYIEGENGDCAHICIDCHHTALNDDLKADNIVIKNNILIDKKKHSLLRCEAPNGPGKPVKSFTNENNIHFNIDGMSEQQRRVLSELAWLCFSS